MKNWRYRKRWLQLAALTCGTTLQLSACREEASLLALRTVVSAVAQPINDFLLQFLSSGMPGA